MIYIPAIVVSAICFYMAHDLTPAVVLGVVSSLIDIASKALPGPSRWSSPSGAVGGVNPAPAWATSAKWFLAAVYLGTLAYCGWWAGQ